MRFNGFLTFLFALVPGGGHMYMGLMKRGLQIMALFFAVFALTVSLDIPGVGVPLLFLIWFYSIFDTLRVRRTFLRGEEAVDNGFVDFNIKSITPYHIGAALIFFGILLALRSLENGILLTLNPVLRLYVRQLWNLIFPALLILGGLYVIQNQRK